MNKSERQQFESWLAKDKPWRTFERDEDGAYADGATDEAWHVWNARAMLQADESCLSEKDVYTLIGHARYLLMIGQNDMPRWCFDLAERMARSLGDEHMAQRTAAVATMAFAEAGRTTGGD